MTVGRNILGKAARINETNYADCANLLIQKGMAEKFGRLTSSKLRGIYSAIMNVYTKVSNPEDFESHRGDIQYLKVKMAYESGREPAVKSFLASTFLMDALDDVNDYETFILYCRYAESLVAYFKFHGGKE